MSSPLWLHFALASAKMARPIVSIIVACRNNAQTLPQCLDSLLSQKIRVPFEVHVVDNSSIDGTYSLARQILKKQKNFFVWKEKKLGLPAAFHHGVKKSRGEVLLFTEGHCVLNPRWAQEMAAPLLKPQHAPLEAIAGHTQIQESEKPSLWEKYAANLNHFLNQDLLKPNPHFLPWARALNLGVLKKTFLLMGGFEENWRWSAFDCDFCWRLELCGFRLGYTPKAIATLQTKNNFRTILRQMENFAYYQQSLIETYQKQIGGSRLSQQKNRILGQSKKVLSMAMHPQDLVRVPSRALDMLVLLSTAKGMLGAKVKKARATARLNPTRRGETPAGLEKSLTRGYAHLHQEGWSHWKDPTNIYEGGDLILFQPKRRKRYLLPETHWKIWEIKSERGQSEDAAEALGHDPSDEEYLRAIDQITLDLITHRILPGSP